MKVNGLIVSFLKVLMEKDNKKRRKTFPEHDPNFEKVDVPYAQDDNFYHRFDVFYPKDMPFRTYQGPLPTSLRQSSDTSL